MKKLLISTLALLSAGIVTAAPMSSEIPLPGGGEVATGGGVVSISLDQLIKNVDYKVECHILNKNGSGVDMRFDYSIQSGGGWQDYYLNGKKLESKQGTVTPGDNLSAVVVSSVGAGNALTFVNLDFNNTVVVTNCVAKPVIGVSKN